MAVNVAALADRLKQFEEGAKASEFAKLLWKPKEGIQTVRIVPYKFAPENPFIELKFYYKLAGKTYLAPCTFGKPDPIMDQIETLRSTGSTEDKETAAKMSPVTRTYVPIIVRGEEDQGVRFWGFGVQVYKQLLKLMTNSKYGDITSLSEGRDIDVEFKKDSGKKGKDGKSFPETSIIADPAQTPVVDPTRKDLMEKLKNQTDILTIFPLKTYDELKDVVEKWLNPSAETDNTDDVEDSAALAAAAKVASAPASAPVSAAAKTSAATSTTVVPSNPNLAAEFASFFDTPTV